MQCLVIQQPWAWAVVTGAKNVENRTWKTDYRGPIAILASASKTLVNQITRDNNLEGSPIAFSYGAIIGLAELVDVTPLNESLEQNLWAYGPYCWRFENGRRFAQPISAKGKLKLFALDADLVY